METSNSTSNSIEELRQKRLNFFINGPSHESINTSLKRPLESNEVSSSKKPVSTVSETGDRIEVIDLVDSDDDDDPTPLNKKIKTESLDYQELSNYKIPGTTIDILPILLQQQEVIETKMNNKRTKTNSTNYPILYSDTFKDRYQALRNILDEGLWQNGQTGIKIAKDVYCGSLNILKDVRVLSSTSDQQKQIDIHMISTALILLATSIKHNENYKKVDKIEINGEKFNRDQISFTVYSVWWRFVRKYWGLASEWMKSEFKMFFAGRVRWWFYKAQMNKWLRMAFGVLSNYNNGVKNDGKEYSDTLVKLEVGRISMEWSN